MKITINKIDFTLKFSYRAFKALAEKWQLGFVQQVFEKVVTDVDANAIDTFVDLMWAAISSTKEGKDIDILDVGDWIFENMDRLPEITKVLIDSFPKSDPAEEGKPIVPELPAEN